MTLDNATQRRPSELETSLQKTQKPKEKYRLIMEALAKNPNDFQANEALLYHGRLHEALLRSSRGKIDYSAIPCHLLSVLDKPEDYTTAIIDAKFEELLQGDQLKKTMRLSENPDAFFVGYLKRMAFEYINLFIQGDSQNSRSAFGFGKSQASVAKACAAPVRRMLSNLKHARQIDDAARDVLRAAIVDGYGTIFSGFGAFLYEE